MKKSIVSGFKSNQCSYCGGKNITRGIPVGQNAEVGRIGLKHKSMKVFVGVEELLADLCSDCGTAVRLYVNNSDFKWITKQ